MTKKATPGTDASHLRTKAVKQALQLVLGNSYQLWTIYWRLICLGHM